MDAPTRRRRVLRTAAIAALAVALVPVCVYVGGRLLAGPYEGEGGPLGLAAALFADAFRGRPGALVLLGSPLLLAAIWIAVFWLRRVTPGPSPRARD